MNGIAFIVDVFGLAVLISFGMVAFYCTRDVEWSVLGRLILKSFKKGIDKLR